MLIKNKKWLIIMLVLLIAAVVGRVGYKKFVRPYINAVKHESKFKHSFEEAMKIPDSHWDEKYKDTEIENSYRVALVVNNGGEYTYGKYFKYAAEKLGWAVKIYNNKIDLNILEFDPDFILFFRQADGDLDMEVVAHRSKKYLVLFSSLLTFKDYCGVVSNTAPYMPVGSFGQLLSMSHAVLTSAKDLDMYRQIFDWQKKTFNGIRMLSLVPSIENEPAEPTSLVWIGTGWDSFRSSGDFKKFITLLSENISMKVYGKHNNLTFLAPHTYGGYIAPGMENIEAIRKNGIYLLTNSDWHFKGGEPGMRIFEAVAANAVVISDKHPFAIENFGDSFLYFDQNADAETMYKQVKAHYDWIKANPEKAKAMAARAHQIFLDKFTIEKDLSRIAKMHEYILKQDKEKDLDYPLAY